MVKEYIDRIVDGFINIASKTQTTVLSVVENRGYVISPWFNQIILIFVAILCIYFGLKISQKIVKLLLIIFGVLVIIGTGVQLLTNYGILS